MKSSVALLCALALPAVLVIGCGDDSSPGIDGPTNMVDLSANKDLTMKACSTAATWPTDNVVVSGGDPGVAPWEWVTEGDALKTVGSGQDMLSVELWYQAGTAAPPKTVMLDTSTTYFDCDTCVVIRTGVDLNSGNYDSGFLARSGTVMVTKGDRTPGTGMMNVTGMNVHLVEWDLSNDAAVKNGGCYDVTSFTISGTYSSTDM